MGKKIMAVSLALVMVLSFAACDGEESLLAQEIVDGAMEAQSNIKTCQMDMDMLMDMTGEAMGESLDMTMDIIARGAMDIENNQMQMDMVVTMAMLGEVMDVEMEVYLIGDTMYTMTDMLGMGPTWMKSEMPGGTWEETAEQWGGPNTYVELLELAEIEITGSEIVNGVDCYVVEVTPDMEKLWELAGQQTELTGGMPDIDEEFLDEAFKNYSVKEWIAKDTYLLVKAEIEMAMEVDPEAMGIPGGDGEIAMDMTISMLVYDYNEPVSIELPPGAEDAVEMPSGF